MWLFTVYTTVPLFSLLGATLCPSPSRVAGGLAAALGCLFGTVAGSFLERAKKDAGRCSIIRVLANNLQQALAVEDLRRLVANTRKRFGVAPGRAAAEPFEETALCGIYEELLNALLDGPEHDARDLPLVQRLKAALELDGIVVGAAHKHVAQLLISRGFSGLEGEPMRRAVDKLLFLSDRAFADEEPEEASTYEMGRLRQVLRVSEKEAKQRIMSVSRALYAQNLSVVVDKVDAQTGEALAGASAAFGLDIEEAARMNAETYRQIAVDLVSSGQLTQEGKETLQRARGVLQLSERAAAEAFAAVVRPILRKDVDAVADSLKEEAHVAVEKLEQASKRLTARQQELGLPFAAADDVFVEGFTGAMRSMYNTACKDARINGNTAALKTLDQLVAFSKSGAAVLSKIRNSEAVLTLPAEQASARRLYGIYLERSLDAEAPTGSEPADALARVLELTEADDEAVRVEVCQPRLRQLFVDSIEFSQAEGAEPLAKAKPEVSTQLSRFRLPFDAVQETAMEVYKAQLAKVANRVIKAPEKQALDAARGFLELSDDDVRLLHRKAFAKTYEESVQEAMGRQGIMSTEAREALEQLRTRLGLEADDAKQIFYSVVQGRLKSMMKTVREAWEEATYTKEALVQINKERGKDIGDDPSADGTGAELGIQDSPPLEGVRGYKLMLELTKVADFYLGNKVFNESPNATKEEAYPVTIEKFLDEKVKEEMYGIFAWNAKTCQDTAARASWEKARPTVGGVLGLGSEHQQKVLVRMVSRWCNMFIKQKMGEQGELTEDDMSTLRDWVPMFFGIDKSVTKEMVQATNKGMLMNRVLRLLNKRSVTSEDVQKLREEVEAWDLEIRKDLELSKPQLRSLFRIEVTAALEDPNLNDEQKRDAVASSRESFGLGESEALDELQDLLKARCKACLVNAVGDLLQGNESSAIEEMQRLELLASFATDTGGLELHQKWEVAPAMRKRLVKTYASSAVGGLGGKPPNVKLLEQMLGLSEPTDA